MRVLVGIPCLMTGGTEIQTLSLVEALITAGHQVEIACYFEYDEEMVHRYREIGATVRLLSSAGTRPRGVKATVSFLWKGLKRTVREFNPDVAHVQYMTPAALVVVILRALGVKKIIATTHTDADIYTPNGLKILRFLTNYILTCLQCITERAEKSYFGSSSVFDGTIKKHFTIYNNIPSHISIRETPRLSKEEEDTIVIGVVSRLESIKGMDLVIPAFTKAAANNPRIKLLIVGDGTLRGSMENQARNSGMEDRIEFLGRKLQSELQELYDKIDILLMPSRSEGFGLTALEGMARGCVPVVANVGGLPEVVTEENGFLHKSEDIDDLSNRIIEAASTKTFNKLSKEAIRSASIFSTEKYQDIINALYKKMLS